MKYFPKKQMSKSASKSNKSDANSSPISSSVNNDDQSKQQPTLVSLYEIDEKNDSQPHRCGYCGTNGSISVGMSSDLMQIVDYQQLIDRGWRRSGTYLYKPKMNRTCCPLYTIKCDALEFQMRKSQKHCLKTVRKFLQSGKEAFTNRRDEKSDKAKRENEEEEEESSYKKIKIDNSKFMAYSNKNTLSKSHAQVLIDYCLSNPISQTDDIAQILNIPKLKAKHKRLFRKLCDLKKKNLIHNLDDVEKCLKRGLSKSMDQQNFLDTYLKVESSSSRTELKNKLDIKLLRSWPPSKEFYATLDEEHKLYAKYQTRIHKDTQEECSMSQFKRFLCTSPLLMRSYPGALEECDKTQLENTICGNLAQLGYGSFHQQYRINGKLIAVGVIDILNHCVSSVYFFYDPDYSFLKLGSYSALQEISLVRHLNKIDSNIKWYYLGYYVHTCRKMRYKGLFYPSYLLCPETFTWHALEECVRLLDARKYARFAPQTIQDQDENESIDQVKIRIKFRANDTRILKFKDFENYLNENYVEHFRKLISNYSKLFGKTFSQRVLIRFD